MKEAWLIKKSGHRHLILFMLGWGATPNAVHQLPFPEGYDVLCCYDHRKLRPLNAADFAGYERIYLFAWSFGVWVAEQSCQELPLHKAIAINGTPTPIDDERGIPSAIFDGTLATLSENGLARFRRRMCGGASAMANFMEHAPQRDLEDLRTELAALGNAIRTLPVKPFPWTQAVGCTNDKIFPIAAQQAAWPQLTTLAGEHWQPDLFERLLKGLPA